jgi:hypothetical protein
MPNVLRMTAIENCDPVTSMILSESDNPAIHQILFGINALNERSAN